MKRGAEYLRRLGLRLTTMERTWSRREVSEPSKGIADGGEGNRIDAKDRTKEREEEEVEGYRLDLTLTIILEIGESLSVHRRN